MKGWSTPEESLYPQVQEALTSWTTANGPRHVVYRLVGEQWAPRSHVLRDILSLNAFRSPSTPLIRQTGGSSQLTMASTWSACLPLLVTTVRYCKIRASPRLPRPTGSMAIVAGL